MWQKLTSQRQSSLPSSSSLGTAGMPPAHSTPTTLPIDVSGRDLSVPSHKQSPPTLFDHLPQTFCTTDHHPSPTSSKLQHQQHTMKRREGKQTHHHLTQQRFLLHTLLPTTQPPMMTTTTMRRTLSQRRAPQEKFHRMIGRLTRSKSHLLHIPTKLA